MVLSVDGGETIQLDDGPRLRLGARRELVAARASAAICSRRRAPVLHSKAMFCHECGHGALTGAKFCPDCGTPPRRRQAARGRAACRWRRGGTSPSSSSTSRARPRSASGSIPRRCGGSSRATSARSRRSSRVTAARSRSSPATRSSPSSACRSCTRTMRSERSGRRSRRASALAVVNDELVRDYGLGLNTRTGVNTGEVVARRQPDREHTRDGRHGQRRRAARARAQPGEIVIGAATYRLVRDAITVEELEPLELKGKSQPVAAYRVVDIAPDAPGLARRLESPIVGRSLELAQLLDAFEEAVRARARAGSRRSSARRARASRGSRTSSRPSSASARRCSRAAASPTARASPTSRSRSC